MIRAPHWGALSIPSQAKLIKAEPSSVMNNLSPRVVSIPRTPLRGTSGYLIAKIVKVIKVSAITPKKAAVGQVHAIQSIVFLLFLFLHAA
jgi:hypothetical protein